MKLTEQADSLPPAGKPLHALDVMTQIRDQQQVIARLANRVTEAVDVMTQIRDQQQVIARLANRVTEAVEQTALAAKRTNRRLFVIEGILIFWALLSVAGTFLTLMNSLPQR